ncbi:MAG: Ig-like domain-containing protein, partial [Clostridia bacterium]|nr:Ig-like domain-containing protein [Clostridia bacterium]
SIEDHYNGASISDQGVLSTGWSDDITVVAMADNGVSDSIQIYIRYPNGDFTIESRYAIQTGETVMIDPVESEGYDSCYALAIGTPGIAQVNDMTITGLKPGRTELTVTSWDGVVHKAEVLVYDPIDTIEITEIESKNGKVSLSDPMHHLFATMNFRAHSAAISDKTYTDDLVTWSSSDSNVIRVQNAVTGEFRTVNYGEATLTATAANGVTASIDLHVYKEVDTYQPQSEYTAYVLSDLALEMVSISPADAYDGFIWAWQDQAPVLGTIEGNVLHVGETAGDSTLKVSTWDGNKELVKTAQLHVIAADITGLSVDDAEYEQWVGARFGLTAHVTAGSEYVNHFVTWASSDEEIAEVDEDGVVTVKAEGDFSVTVTTTDGQFAQELAFTAVQGIEAFAVPGNITLYPDENPEIVISDIEPVNAADRPFTYTSSDETVVTVEDGRIIPHTWDDSSATITVRSQNGLERAIEVTVKRPDIENISISTPAYLVVGGQGQVTVQVEADGEIFTNRFVTWHAEDPNVVSIDANGVVNALQEGGTDIYVYSMADSMYSANAYIDVYNIDAISVYDDLRLTVGQTVDARDSFAAYSSLAGDVVSDVKFSYSSTDESIVNVDEEGLVTAIAKGSTEIIATYTDTGLSASVPVTVYQKVNAFDLPGRILVPVAGEGIALPVQNIAPRDAQATDLVWTVEPEYLASVQDGAITAMIDYDEEGTITASTPDGRIVKTAKLVVYSPWVDRIEFEPLEYIPSFEDVQVVAHVFVGEEEYINQLVTFEAYWDEGLTSDCGYMIDAKSGVANISSSEGMIYVVARAKNDITAVMPVKYKPAYTSFEVKDTLFLHPNESSYIDVISYDSIRGYNPNHNSYLFYRTENTDAVSVDTYGYVYANSDCGIYNVTVSSINGVSRVVKVVVFRDEDIAGLRIAPVKINHPIYESINLQALVSLYGEEVAANQLVTWSSDAPKVISVNVAGAARTLGIGTATITAMTSNGHTASITLEVQQEPDNFTIQDTFETTYGQQLTLGYESVEPADATMELSWTVEPANVASIEDGDTLIPSINREAVATLTATNWDGTVRNATLIIHMDISKLSTLSLPAALTEIDEEAFEGIAAERVVIPEGCISIGSRAFADADKLLAVQIPGSVSYIAEDAFSGCSEVTIYCASGSYAETYAMDNGMPYVSE